MKIYVQREQSLWVVVPFFEEIESMLFVEYPALSSQIFHSFL